MNELEQTIMKMISFGGEGKSYAFRAIQLAEDGYIKESLDMIEKAKLSIDKARLAHADVLFYEANHQEDFKVTALLLHAADHVSNGEDVYELATHFVKLIKEMKEGQKNV